MPTYPSQSPVGCKPDEIALVWNAEQPAAGNGGVSASLAVALQRVSGEVGTPFSVTGLFSGAPGAFEIDVQGSDHDVDAEYQTLANMAITSVDATNQTFEADVIQVNKRFARLLMRIRTNAVNVTARIKR